MGNALGFLYGHCCKPSATGESDSLAPHGVAAETAGVSAAAAGVAAAEAGVAAAEAGVAAAAAGVASAAAGVASAAAGVAAATAGVSAPAQGVTFEFHTLPVDARCVTDGDDITVYVSTSDPRESRLVPQEVQKADVERSEALAQRDCTRADALHKSIVSAGYRVIDIQNDEVLARKYRIRLRGVDAPEGQMPYGNEAKEELLKIVQGHSLRVIVYGEDQYGRLVGDIYCNGIFVQELMLKRGMAWHYTAYDQRAEFAEWERNARAERVGLWASSNPEEPWKWRRRNGRKGRCRLRKSDYSTFCHSRKM